MSHTNDTTDIVIRLPREHVRSATVSLHLRSPDLYRELTGDPDHDVTESSANTGDHWHRWAEYDDDNGVRYVVHDPERYTADPLGNDKRVRELHEMLSAVLNATDMTAAEKATEVARLSERITALLQADVRDDIVTISEAALIPADEVAPGGES